MLTRGDYERFTESFIRDHEYNLRCIRFCKKFITQFVYYVGNRLTQMDLGINIFKDFMNRNSVKRGRKSLLKVVLMGFKRLFLSLLILIIGCQHVSVEPVKAGQVGENQENPIITASSIETEPKAEIETELDEQLELNRHLLLNDANIDMRTKTASVLLSSKNPNARKILIDTLSLTNDNADSAARIAVCRALIQTRTSQDEISSKDDFIQPLLNMLSTEVDEEAQFAADAILIYRYEEVGHLLDELVANPEVPVRTRINAIGALKKFPEKDAIIRLIKLVDDPKEQVAAEAEKALRASGFQVGTSSSDRQKIIADFQNKEMVEVFGDLLINKESQIRQLQAELESLQAELESSQKFILGLLEKIYRGINDNTEKGKFLVEYLKDPKPDVKLWALEQVEIEKRSTNPIELPVEINPILLNLISNQDRNVRLKTAELLVNMTELNSASELLAQLNVETDEQVKGQLLDTLGWICFYALSQSTSFKVPPEVRMQALEKSEEFLVDDNVQKALIGTRVMKKLLERNGLKPDIIIQKLSSIEQRYQRQIDEPNNSLRGGLLDAMAGLVANSSACKAQASKLFEPIFQEALTSETAFIRETAVTGLANMNEVMTLKLLRERFTNDPSPIINKIMIDIANRIGGTEDLNWLWGKISSNSVGQSAWKAMMRIFNDSDTNVLKVWTNKLTVEQNRLTNTQKIAFFKIAEAKAVIEDKPQIREILADLFLKINQYEQAASYFNDLYNAALTSQKKEEILPKLLDSCLRCSNIDILNNLVVEHLSKLEMISPDNIVIRSIDNYMSDVSVVTDKDEILKTLSGISVSDNINWKKYLQQWKNIQGITQEPEESNIRSNPTE